MDTPADRAKHLSNVSAGVAERPRLVKLGQLIDEALADAVTAHEAYTAGRPRLATRDWQMWHFVKSTFLV